MRGQASRAGERVDPPAAGRSRHTATTAPTADPGGASTRCPTTPRAGRAPRPPPRGRCRRPSSCGSRLDGTAGRTGRTSSLRRTDRSCSGLPDFVRQQDDRTAPDPYRRSRPIARPARRPDKEQSWRSHHRPPEGSACSPGSWPPSAPWSGRSTPWPALMAHPDDFVESPLARAWGDAGHPGPAAAARLERPVDGLRHLRQDLAPGVPRVHSRRPTSSTGGDARPAPSDACGRSRSPPTPR